MDIAKNHPWAVTAAATAVGAAALAAAVHWHFAPIQLTGIPGPDENRLKTITKAFASGRGGYILIEDVQKYGKIHKIYIGFPMGYSVIRCADAQLMQYVWSHEDEFHRPPNLKVAVGEVVTHALFVMDGPIWKRHRKQLIKAFSVNTYRHAISTWNEKTLEMIKDFNNEQEIDPVDVFGNLGFLALCKALFSFDESTKGLDGKLTKSFKIISKGFIMRLSTPRMFWWAKLKDHQELKEAKDNLARVMKEALAAKESIMETTGKKAGNDIIDLLLAAREFEGESAMTDDEITDEILGLFFAGAETSSNAISFACVRLSENPQIQARAYEEIKTAIGDGEPTYEILSEMKYMTNLVKETLRMHPTVYVLPRITQKDLEFKGMKLPKDSRLALCVEAMHNHPDYYEKPEAFWPERWETESEWLVPGSYLPFGLGAHRCIGERFALLQIRAVLSIILREFEIVPMANPPDVNDTRKYLFTQTMSEHKILLKRRKK